MRRLGSAALDLCGWPGRLDAHYEHGLNVWDWAAGALIAAGAGAVSGCPRPVNPLGLTLARRADSPTRCAARWRFCGALGPLPGCRLPGSGPVDLRDQRGVGGLSGVRPQAGQLPRRCRRCG